MQKVKVTGGKEKKEGKKSKQVFLFEALRGWGETRTLRTVGIPRKGKGPGADPTHKKRIKQEGGKGVRESKKGSTLNEGEKG